MGGRGSGGGAGNAGGVQGQIQNAYDTLAGRPGQYVPLADLRERLSAQGFTRAQVDRALMALAVKSGVHVIPWDNLKALTPRQRAAALRIGGEDAHAIRFDPR